LSFAVVAAVVAAGITAGEGVASASAPQGTLAAATSSAALPQRTAAPASPFVSAGATKATATSIQTSTPPTHRLGQFQLGQFRV
jgi:hypothetical protein